MQKLTKALKNIINSVTAWMRRHRILCITILSILFVYLFIRLFLTPPILSQTHFSRAFYDRDGKLMRLTLSGDEKYRLFTPLSEINPSFVDAVILYEDKYFRYHPGINPVALTRATINYFGGSSRPIGASTITMQVARLRYDLNTKQPSGKIKQIFYALYLDAFYSKNEIIQAYLNMAPYGGNIEGVGAASLIYFGKRADDLSKIESITLATVPQNPTKRNLLTASGLNNIKTMRHDLVRRWVEFYPSDNKLITLADMPLNVGKISDLPFYAPHFTDRLIARQNNYWRDIGNTASEITTTLDLNLQRRLERALTSEILQRKSIGVENAAMVLVNYKTMEVISHIGSVNYFDKKIYGENDGVYAKRSPGSTLKPLIYAAATDRGFIHGMTLLRDAKINFGVYAPENSDNEFYGPVLARNALTHSRNIPAIELVRKVGTRNFYRLLRDFEISNLRGPEHYGISIALGGAELSMIELADIYATMANLGMRHKIRTDMNSQLDDGKQILSPEAFFMVIDMLSHQGTPETRIPFAKRQTNKLKHYWKTGTSSSFRDAWTAGVFGDNVLIVWVGNFDGKPNNAFSGAKTAAPIYFSLANSIADYYNQIGKPISNPNFFRDDLNISYIDMCDTVGGIAGTNCPKSIRSAFIPGVSPIETSSIYRAVPIDIKTGKRACDFDPATTRMLVYEFWDPEYLDMFKNAGIKRKTPPPYVAGCDLDTIMETRSKPVIVSPIDQSRIVITTNSDTEPVTFRAINDMENTKIFWFLDDRMIGTSTSGTVFQHTVPMGEHRIRAIDELGGATEIEFTIVK
ncbi:penicillin-binding protein 1C [Lachnospiraceae bacterium OttesenSCG-928-E19]|nr:penicillin-binding protein 1C [Lachnospiraceae bacterium OttesenSCG-928-E19]